MVWVGFAAGVLFLVVTFVWDRVRVARRVIARGEELSRHE
jgi:hypothetical protein